MKPTLVRRMIAAVLGNDSLNFVLTNHIPRRALTRLMARISRIEHPLFARPALALWQACSDLDLNEAKRRQFRSLHDCFIRELRPGARPFNPDPDTLCSPCDAIVGACGEITGDLVLQAKGMPYPLSELTGTPNIGDRYRGGRYLTLRITASMYHRFHAPDDARIEHVQYFPGDTWNVNPPALARVDRLFCRNERAAIRMRLQRDDTQILLVPVAAVLVASLRLHALDLTLHAGYRGPHALDCNHDVARGQEMGWFEHGSTIIMLVPAGFELHPHMLAGHRLRAGEVVMRRRLGDSLPGNGTLRMAGPASPPTSTYRLESLPLMRARSTSCQTTHPSRVSTPLPPDRGFPS